MSSIPQRIIAQRSKPAATQIAPNRPGSTSPLRTTSSLCNPATPNSNHSSRHIAASSLAQTPPLARAADKVILIPATAPDIVVRAAVFEHAASLCLDAVFNVLADRLKLDLDEFRKRHANLE